MSAWTVFAIACYVSVAAFMMGMAVEEFHDKGNMSLALCALGVVLSLLWPLTLFMAWGAAESRKLKCEKGAK